MNRIRSLWTSGRRGKLVVGCGGLAALVGLCLCSLVAWTQTPAGQVSVATANANQTATRLAAALLPTTTPPATATPDPFQGIGATRRVWEASHGKVVERSTSSGSRYDTPAGSFYVEYYDPAVFGDPNDIVSRIGRGFPEAVALDTARAEVAPLLPPDARLVKTSTVQYRHDKGILEVYMSNALPARLVRQSNIKGDLWHGAPPGSFVVVYRFTEPGRITSWYIQPGQTD